MSKEDLARMQFYIEDFKLRYLQALILAAHDHTKELIQAAVNRYQAEGGVHPPGRYIMRLLQGKDVQDGLYIAPDLVLMTQNIESYSKRARNRQRHKQQALQKIWTGLPGRQAESTRAVRRRRRRRVSSRVCRYPGCRTVPQGGRRYCSRHRPR